MIADPWRTTPSHRFNKRNEVLHMHHARTKEMSKDFTAQRGIGVDMSYYNTVEETELDKMKGYPGVFETDASFEEEKFRFHALRNSTYVAPLPVGFQSSWHSQYSTFTATDIYSKRLASVAVRTIDSIKKRAIQVDDSVLGDSFVDLPEFLLKNVKRFDNSTAGKWMNDLASGTKHLQELIQLIGVPFKQWRSTLETPQCPLLDFILEFRPGYLEATWYIQLNVLYTELDDATISSVKRVGDNLFHPKRLSRRSTAWTEQLIASLHGLEMKDEMIAQVENKVEKTWSKTEIFPCTYSPVCSVRNHRNGSDGLGSSNIGDSFGSSNVSIQEKWSYLLKLSEYQYKLGLLDVYEYFDGLLSLLQKGLTSTNGTRCMELGIAHNQLMELVAMIHGLLPEITRVLDSTISLVKILIHHFRCLLPSVDASLHNQACTRELLGAICQMLRDILSERPEILVFIDEAVLAGISEAIFDQRLFYEEMYTPVDIRQSIASCRSKLEEGTSRNLRMDQANLTLSSPSSARNEAEMIQCLDSFHRVDTSIDIHKVYHQIFSAPLGIDAKSLSADMHAIFVVCEWAITSQRPAEYRYLSAVSLLNIHNRAVLRHGRRHKSLEHVKGTSQAVLQGPLQNFLVCYEPKLITEVNHIVELFCHLARRRLFCIESFVEFVHCYQERGQLQIPSASMSSAYNIECGPGRGFKTNELASIDSITRLRLYVWQFPRDMRFSSSAITGHSMDELHADWCLSRWLDALQLSKESLQSSKTLERAQMFCVHVFHTHATAEPDDSTTNAQLVVKEVEYQGKLGDLIAAVKILCGHDKGRFTVWFLKKIYSDPEFFRFSDHASVEHIVRLILLVLEIVDVSALLEVLIYFLERTPVYLVRNIVLLYLERHEVAFSASGQIPLLLQAFVNRFNRIPKAADDTAGTVAKFFCRMYYAHAKNKETGKLDLPFALLRPIAETARKNQDAAGQKPKEISLEIVNPIVRIPPAREAMPPELKGAFLKSFKVLQSKWSSSDVENNVASGTVSTPSNADEAQSVSEKIAPYSPPSYGSLCWDKVVLDAKGESLCRDHAIEYAANVINSCMMSSTGANLNTNRERRAPNYVFLLRAIMSEVMDKWMGNISLRSKSNYKRPIMTPQYIHRCVRLIREILHQHSDDDDFQEKFSNILLIWLQKEVLPGFSGSDATKRIRNPFINVENSKEAFALNQKGKLDKVQYGLKAFLVSLVIQKVVELAQILRLVLVPLFPRLRRASRDPPPTLSCQLLAMTLVFQLFSEPPQHMTLEPQKVALFDEPMTKYQFRFLRSQVSASLMFPLVHLLCQISYQLEDNFLLRKREERGTLASITLFNLTSDSIVRDIIFHDTKEAREKHIYPVYHKKQWHTAVLLTHFFRPPNSPAEDANGQIQLLKVHQILEQMNAWILNRGGSIYLDLQMSRQQLKVKRKQTTGTSKRKAPTEVSERASKRLKTSVDAIGSQGCRCKVSRLDVAKGEASIGYEINDNSSATEILSCLIVARLLQKSTRFPDSQILMLTGATCSKRKLEERFCVCGRDFSTNKCIGSGYLPYRKIDEIDSQNNSPAKDMNDLYEASMASLYVSIVGTQPRRVIGSVVVKVLRAMEEDCKLKAANHAGLREGCDLAAVHLLCGIVSSPSGHAFMPPFISSVASQLESLLVACTDYEKHPNLFSGLFLQQLRRKIFIRLHLATTICHSNQTSATIHFRNRVTHALYRLLGTFAVSHDYGVSLFYWIIDVLSNMSVCMPHDEIIEIIASIRVPGSLKKMLWSTFSRIERSTPPLTLDRGSFQCHKAEGSTHLQVCLIKRPPEEMASIDIAALIDDAIDANQNKTNWDLNTLLSDCVNENNDLCDEAFKKIELTLQEATSKSVLHALTLLEYVVGNGSNHVLSLAGRRSFLGLVLALTDGTKGVEVQSKSLLLINQWGAQYGDCENKNFRDTLSMLQRKGVSIPERGDEEIRPSYQYKRHPSDLSSSDSFGNSYGEIQQEPTKHERRQTQIAKLQADLAEVMEKIATSRALLEKADSRQDEQLENLFDFLRQCQPRINALIEGGLQGRISEKMLEECLNVNDHLTRLLEIAQGSELNRS
uniref:Uncharacterized protein AlNc14C88G5603 n=1 Tax=Albugo laibachii Nc14 TaxID=890382 RepID=F0WG73_9STRA|nr:conserved hypothetical protein [Albugo laibachii Nc14]|eukprot:CCA20208.1 conserved hypothetical protein [Albugo laibachii Nc14]